MVAYPLIAFGVVLVKNTLAKIRIRVLKTGARVLYLH